MYDPWQCYSFGTKVFNFLYVTILDVRDLDTLGFVEEWPLNIAGVTQLDSQTHNFDCNAPSQPSPCSQQDKCGKILQWVTESSSTKGQERPLHLNAEAAPTCSTLSRIQDPNSLSAIHKINF